MGTRADFYVGRGEDAEWLGSIAWDGYPDGIADWVRQATVEGTYREKVSKFLAERDDATLPAHGWPWPWETSGTTDFAYAFDGGQVWASRFGRPWVDANVEDWPDESEGARAIFPNMKDRQNVRWDRGSGVIVVSAPAAVLDENQEESPCWKGDR